MKSPSPPAASRTIFAIVLGITLISVLFRTYKINTPLIEYHSWRQADTMSVARNYMRTGIDLLKPQFDDISKLQSGLENPNGYRMVEFPIFNAIVAIVASVFTFWPVAIWGRIINIIFSACSVYILFWLLYREKNLYAAIVGSLVFATYPFFVFYTRTTLPEVFAMTLIMCSVAWAYFRPRTLTTAIGAFALFCLAILVKPTTIFFGLAPFVMFLRWPLTKKRTFPIMVVAALSIVPLLIWREYILKFPEGIPPSEWLITHVNVATGLQPIFFRPAFFRWVFYERINMLVLGSFSFVFLVFGSLAKTKTWLPYLMGISGLLYIFTFQGGNVQHEYYQILLLPTIALFVGLGAERMYSIATTWYAKVLAVLITIALLIAGWFISYDKVRHYYYSLSDIPQFARVVQALTEPTDRIVVDTGGDTTALYAFDRKGAPAIVGTPEELRGHGYTHLFTYVAETARNLKKDYDLEILFQNDRFTLFKL